jgi:RNA polymerase sigma-70 factor (ECF subfamily)
MNNICSSYNIKQLKQKNPIAFARLYREYKDKIINFILIKTGGNINIAEEVSCETFHSALKSAPTLKNTDNLNNWLLKIASRRLNDHFKKLYREKKYHCSYDDLKLTASDFCIHTHYLLKQKSHHINEAIDNLNERYKTVIRLKYIEKKAIKDIAFIMNKSTTSINSILERARASLKKKILEINI